MGRDDERRPSSSRNLYWEVFFSPDGAELAEFAGFFGLGAASGALGSAFFTAFGPPITKVATVLKPSWYVADTL